MCAGNVYLSVHLRRRVRWTTQPKILGMHPPPSGQGSNLPITPASKLQASVASDESSLWDFHVESDNSRLNAKIMEVYGVDVSDIQSGRLAAIFERIVQSRTEAPHS